MKKFLIISIVALGLAYLAFTQNNPAPKPATAATLANPRPTGDHLLSTAFENRRHNLAVQGQGIVIKLLSDDISGTRHQRFIIQLASGQTLLLTHNINLAPRIFPLHLGDAVEFQGIYEWNAQGGVIHWTHHDPAGKHSPGWIKHQGKTYQ